jgi:hypothetical protein
MAWATTVTGFASKSIVPREIESMAAANPNVNQKTFAESHSRSDWSNAVQNALAALGRTAFPLPIMNMRAFGMIRGSFIH